MLKSSLFIILITFVISANADVALSDLNDNERNQLGHIVTSNYCTCGCNKTILNCINTHLSCTTSPALAQSLINQIYNSRTHYQTRQPQQNRARIYNYDGGGGYVSGRSSNGRNCTTVSVPGSGSFRSCD